MCFLTDMFRGILGTGELYTSHDLEMGEMRSRIVYVGNPKHKEPRQRGRKGSLCPKSVTLERAQALLDESLCCDGVRFALLDGVAFVGRSDSAGRLWHGYPVGWMEVPRSVWMKWLKEGRLKRSDIARYWRYEEDF